MVNQRSKFAQTAVASSGVPSWNVTPSRRVNVQVLPSGVDVHSVARPGSSSVVPGL